MSLIKTSISWAIALAIPVVIVGTFLVFFMTWIDLELQPTPAEPRRYFVLFDKNMDFPIVVEPRDHGRWIINATGRDIRFGANSTLIEITEGEVPVIDALNTPKEKPAPALRSPLDLGGQDA